MSTELDYKIFLRECGIGFFFFYKIEFYFNLNLSEYMCKFPSGYLNSAPHTLQVLILIE